MRKREGEGGGSREGEGGREGKEEGGGRNGGRVGTTRKGGSRQNAKLEMSIGSLYCHTYDSIYVFSCGQIT